MTKRKEILTCEQAVYFRNEFREARYDALKYAGGYQRILFVVERLGAYLTGEYEGSLSKFETCINKLVESYNPLAKTPEGQLRDYHTPFGKLYEMIMTERNDALHRGAFVKILTSHLIQLSIILEDSLVTIMADPIQHYMTRNPTCAYPWQPVSFVRQMMLENSFSYIPVRMKRPGDDREKWYIISDYDVVDYLKPATGKSTREKRLSKTLDRAVADKPDLIRKAVIVPPDKKVKEALGYAQAIQSADGHPILVKRKGCPELLGIATPFDLM